MPGADSDSCESMSMTSSIYDVISCFGVTCFVVGLGRCSASPAATSHFSESSRGLYFSCLNSGTHVCPASRSQLSLYGRVTRRFLASRFSRRSGSWPTGSVEECSIHNIQCLQRPVACFVDNELLVLLIFFRQDAHVLTLVALERTQYNCPWAKIGLGK